MASDKTIIIGVDLDIKIMVAQSGGYPSPFKNTKRKKFKYFVWFLIVLGSIGIYKQSGNKYFHMTMWKTFSRRSSYLPYFTKLDIKENFF